MWRCRHWQAAEAIAASVRAGRLKGRIAAEARLDGVYVIRTSLDSASLGPEAAVEA